MCGLPMPIVEPVPSVVTNVIYAGRIVLLNPAETGADIHFLLDGKLYSLDSGYMQDMKAASTIIRFDRGGDFGEALYLLKPGSYRFVLTDHGLDLEKASFEAVLDNTANAQDFHLLIDGKPVAISARSASTVKSAYPLQVAFDSGFGGELVRKHLHDEETYTIGINHESGLWDLFPGDAAASGAGSDGDVHVVAIEDELPSEPEEEVSAPLPISP